MKISALVRILIWAVIACVLIGIFVAALAVPNMLSRFSINMPFSCAGAGSVYYDDAERYTPGGGSVAASGIREIELNWVEGRVNIVEGTGDSIRFSETGAGALEEKYQLHSYVKGDKLIIQFCKANTRTFQVLNKTLTLELPQGMELTELTVQSVSAKVEIGKASAEKLSITTVSGAMEATGIKAGTIKAEAVSGNIMLSQSSGREFSANSISGSILLENSQFEEVNADGVSGEIALSPGNVLKRLKAESVSGNLRVTLPENMPFTASYDSVSGNFQCDFPVEMQKERAIYLGGGADIDLETISGGIYIHKE